MLLCLTTQPYFVPGAPREGFSLSYKLTSSGTNQRKTNFNLGSSQVSFGTPDSFADASIAGQQESAVWASRAYLEPPGGWPIKMTCTMRIRPYDLFFTVNVKIKNEHSSKTLYDAKASTNNIGVLSGFFFNDVGGNLFSRVQETDKRACMSSFISPCSI